MALGLAALLAWIQCDEPALIAGDSYFHARAAQQLAEHGVLEQFPQAFYSTWAERYSDKDFLFQQRVWMLKRTPSIDGLTASGDNISIDTDDFVLF